MSKIWKNFLFVEFPVAVLLIASIAQLLAWVLSDVPMRRNRTDELALAMAGDPANYRVILLADSITRNATAHFAVGKQGEIGNLATHAHFGIAGEILLLQRYLHSHQPPEYVVMAFAPAMYHSIGDVRLVRYTLWHTFRGQDERRFLKAQFPDIDGRDWLPAAADLQVRIVEPLFSLLKTRYLRLRMRETAHVGSGSRQPNPQASTEASNQSSGALDTARAEALNIADAPVNREALLEICRMSQRYGFSVRLAWPPMPAELRSVLSEAGALERLETQLRSVMAGRCQIGEVFDFNRVRNYPSAGFHLDMIHLFGDGWEQRYASDLGKYLDGLIVRNTAAEVTRATDILQSP